LFEPFLPESCTDAFRRPKAPVANRERRLGRYGFTGVLGCSEQLRGSLGIPRRERNRGEVLERSGRARRKVELAVTSQALEKELGRALSLACVGGQLSQPSEDGGDSVPVSELPGEFEALLK